MEPGIQCQLLIEGSFCGTSLLVIQCSVHFISMIFDCKASLSFPNCPIRFTRAKVAIGAHNGFHYIVLSFPSFREKLCVTNISSVHTNTKGTSATVTFIKPSKTLTIDASDAGPNLIPHFKRTITALRRGDKKIKESVPPIDFYERQLRHQPKSYVVEGNNFDIKAFANNELEKVVFTKTKCLLPKGIFRLDFLKELHLIDCNLDDVPERIVNLNKTLSVLDLSNNKIKKLNAKQLSCLRQLTLLNLSHNEIQRIPLEIVFLRNLTSLDVSFNQISRVPFTIGLLAKLRHLNLSHNRLQCFPRSILHPPTASMKVQRLRLDSLDLSSNEPIVPFTSTDNRCLSKQPPSLYALSARITISATFHLKKIQEWLPYTVYDDLQESADICSHCHSPSFVVSSAIFCLSPHFSLLSNTLVTDASTQRIPVVCSVCPVCLNKITQ